MSVAVSRESPSHGLSSPLSYSAAGIVIPFSLTASAAVLWADSLQGIALAPMSGLGLISVLPPQTFVALILYAAGFAIALFQPKILAPLLLLQLATWIFMLHGINSLVLTEPAFSVAWRHAGITDYIIRHRSVDPNLDAYFSWPGFFGLSALVTKAAALSGPVALIRWAPVFFNLLYLAPLAVIFKAATTDRRTMWLALWFFYTTNWIGQDYFSPQAFAYFVYLLVLGILLKWFRTKRGESAPIARRPGRVAPTPEALVAPREDPETQSPESGGRERMVAATVAILAFAAIVPSHQLTPFALLLGVALLVLFRQVTLRGLPTLMAVLIGTWISYMTVTFLAGHLGLVFDPLGLRESAAVNVERRLQGSPEHLAVVYGRVAMSALVWLLAAWGATRIRRMLKGYRAHLILVAAPFPLLLLQPYGGEMLLRLYLLILPFCSLFVAGLFTSRSSSTPPSAKTAGLAALLSFVLLSGFLLARYGNETIDRVTSGEIEAVSRLYELAPKGSLLLAADANLPWKHKHYEDYDYRTLDEYELEFSSEEALRRSVAEVLERPEGPAAFFIVTKGQKEAVNLLGLPAPTDERQLGFSSDRRWLLDLENTLKGAPNFVTVFANTDAAIFALAGKS
ncbi:MAG: hypothetical protein WD627_12205 [Actinomycetota bacterium]